MSNPAEFATARLDEDERMTVREFLADIKAHAEGD